jgi:AraC-like DNA-binding protein
MTPEQLVKQILDRIREENNLNSDDALAQHLHVSDTAIYRWRKGELHKSVKILLPELYRLANDSKTAA